MYIARSMRLGGEIVYPDECDFSSYEELLLRCCFCGEKVCLKKGDIRKPHFAHFPSTDIKQVEECERRASSYSQNKQINSFIEDRGQRAEIFEQRFISLIYVDNQKIIDDLHFKSWNNSVKTQNFQVINNITKACAEYFLAHQTELKKIYFIPLIRIKDNKILLQQRIALEAIDYLCVKSSLHLLEYLLHYSIYKLYKKSEYKLFKGNITTQNIDNICHYLIKRIIFNSWIQAFNINTTIPLVNNVKRRQHNSTSGYIGTHNTKTKICTVVELSTSVQKLIDTRLLSSIFQLPQYQYGLELQITEQGNIILNEYHPSGRRNVGVIAKVTGIHYQYHAHENIRIFDWVYYDSFKNRSEVLDKQIRRHLNKCNKDVCYLLSKYPSFEVKDDGSVGKMSRNKKKYVVKGNRYVYILN